MNPNLFLLVTILITSLTQSNERLGWRGITPLRSTRTEVERELGAIDLRCQCYENEKEIVHVNYASGPCTGDLPGWNVPAGTVLSLSVSPKDKFKFSELEPNPENFVKTSDDIFSTYYGNGKRGVRYSVSSSGFIADISYFPSINDNALRCSGFPATDGGITSYVPYYGFPFETLEDIISRVGEFGVRLRKLHNYKGYLIVYAGRDKKIVGVAAFANKARSYLIDELEIDPQAIDAVNGGYRDQSTVELFLIPSDWPPPVPTPSIGGILK